MVAALAVALCFGGIVAALAQPGKEIGVVFAMVAAFVGALAIAAILTLVGLAFAHRRAGGRHGARVAG